MKKIFIFLLLAAAGIITAILIQDVNGCPKDGKDECLLKVAAQPDKEISFCTQISSQSLQDDCYYMFASDKAQGPEACAMISEVTEKDKCYMLFVSDKRLDPQVCPSISSTELRDKCNNFVAKEYLDVSSCSSIASPAMRKSCLDYLQDAGNIQSCQYYQDASDRDACFENAAQGQADPSFCYSISDSASRDNCIFDFAQDLAYPDSLCADITGAGGHDANTCYFNRALIEKNRGLCTMITAKDQRDVCIRGIELATQTEGATVGP